MTGVVEAFDEHRGYGTLRTDAGEELFFHCTRITDGSRMIELGARVSFAVVPGLGGRWEATEIQPLR